MPPRMRVAAPPIEVPSAQPRELRDVTIIPPVSEAQAQMAAAMAIERLAVAVETLKPAADTVHGFGDRLDKLCTWLTGKWPWIAGVAVLVLQRAIEGAPDQLPKLLEGLGALLKGFTS